MRIAPIFLLLATSASPASAQNWPGRSARAIDMRVEVLDSALGIPKVFFHDGAARGISSPTVSPGGRYVAVAVFHDTSSRPQLDDPVAAGVVRVFDGATGQSVAMFIGGNSAAWCGQTCLAVTFGTLSDDPDDQQFGDSLAIFGLPRSIPVATFHRDAWAFYRPVWDPSRNRLQMMGDQGLRVIDLSTLQLKVIPRAPTSYLRAVSGSGTFTINELGAGNWVAHVDTLLAPPGVADSIAWNVDEWLGRTDFALLRRLGRFARSLAPNQEYRIWDVAADTVSPAWVATPTGWLGPAPNGCRLFLKEGRLTAAPGCR